MQLQKSQPVPVADLPATELGGPGENSHLGTHIAGAATIQPSTGPRYPLVPPAKSPDSKRPWNAGVKGTTMHVEHQSTPKELPVREPAAAGVASHPIQTDASNALMVSNRSPKTPIDGQEEIRPCKLGNTLKVLLLCGGPNSREVSIYNLFLAAGFECTN